jgi:magnesium chelatase family protein
MLATIASAALQGIDAETVHVEVNTGEVGDPKLILVGLPDAAVKESDDRVFSALSNSGFALPRTRTTINLAPGNLRKEGPFYDLPIALGILAATKQLAADHLGEWLIAGELSLSGATRPVRGALAMARLARSQHRRGLLLPGVSAEEAALVEGIPVYRIDSLDRAVRFLKGEIHLAPLPAGRRPAAPTATSSDANPAADFSEIKGQHALRRAIEVAVAGGHNLLMISFISPGTGLRAARRIGRVDFSPERLRLNIWALRGVPWAIHLRRFRPTSGSDSACSKHPDTPAPRRPRSAHPRPGVRGRRVRAGRRP